MAARSPRFRACCHSCAWTASTCAASRWRPPRCTAASPGRCCPITSPSAPSCNAPSGLVDQAQAAGLDGWHDREGVDTAGEFDLVGEAARGHHASDAAIEQRLRDARLAMEGARRLGRVGKIRRRAEPLGEALDEAARAVEILEVEV